ncbi:serine/threonine protein kinase, partial [Streptomyces sp. NPDC005921]
VVFEMLAGGPPFVRDEDIALLWAHQYDQPPALSEVRSGLPPRFDEVFARALAKAPEDRYGTCLEFVGALRLAAHGAGPAEAWTPSRPTSRSACPSTPATTVSPPAS